MPVAHDFPSEYEAHVQQLARALRLIYMKKFLLEALKFSRWEL